MLGIIAMFIDTARSRVPVAGVAKIHHRASLATCRNKWFDSFTSKRDP